MVKVYPRTVIFTEKTSKALAPRAAASRPSRTPRFRIHIIRTHYVRAFTTKFRAH